MHRFFVLQCCNIGLFWHDSYIIATKYHIIQYHWYTWFVKFLSIIRFCRPCLNICESLYVEAGSMTRRLISNMCRNEFIGFGFRFKRITFLNLFPFVAANRLKFWDTKKSNKILTLSQKVFFNAKSIQQWKKWNDPNFTTPLFYGIM